MKSHPVSHHILSLLLACGLAACSQSPEPEAASGNPSQQELGARIAKLERQIETAEALRAVKRLQWAYGHYSEFGLWHDFADLFADTGIGHYTQGDLDREGIRALFLEQVGQGQLGLARGRIYPHISFAPVVTVDADSGRIEGRFRILALLGGFGGNALWFHGVYENAYVRERGVWKIDEVSNAAQITGTFATGLSASPGGRPAIAFHYSPGDLGRVDGASLHAGSAESVQRQAGTLLAGFDRRLDRLEDETAIVNLQHRLVDSFNRHIWDDVAGLFAEQGTFEYGLQGMYIGQPSIRRALNLFIDPPMPAGEIDDRFLFQTYVSVAPDGRTARARVDELGLQGNPEVSARWTQGIYENTFIREGDAWRVESLRYYPRLITDYALGWGADAQAVPGPSSTIPPDAPPTERYGIYPEFHIPPLHFAHPVTGRPPQYPEGDPAATQPVGFVEAPGAEAAEADAVAPADAANDPGADVAALEAELSLAEARVQRVLAHDAVENLLAAYAYYLDECMTTEAAALFPASGNELGANGDELTATACVETGQDAGMTLRHVTQPEIAISEDGRSARFSARIWEVHATDSAADTYRIGRLEGYALLANGRWQLVQFGSGLGEALPAPGG